MAEQTTRVEQEIVRDTTIVIEPDSASLKAWLECDSNNAVIMSKLERKQGHTTKIEQVALTKQPDNSYLLDLMAVTHEMSIEIQLKDKLITELSSKTIAIKERYLTGWDKFIISLGYLALVVIVILTITIILKLWLQR